MTVEQGYLSHMDVEGYQEALEAAYDHALMAEADARFFRNRAFAKTFKAVLREQLGDLGMDVEPVFIASPDTTSGPIDVDWREVL